MLSSPDFREFVELLNKNNVDYLVTGGYAVGVYGYPRYTGDLDLWVRSLVANGERLVQVFNSFGLSSFRLTPKKIKHLSTYMSGKWHVTPYVIDNPDKHNWPRQRGFDKFFGMIAGAGSL